jgi:hemoglobin/transferrin/lactoferrin receptor protein
VYLIQKQSKIYANVGNAFRSPNEDDMGKIFDSKVGSALIMPNANLKPEQTVTAEIGTQLMLSKKLSLEANGYYTRLWNAIVVAPATINGADSLLYDGKLTATYTMANAQNAYLFGYHFQIEYELNKRIKIQSGVNYTYGRILGDSIMPMDHVPPLFGRSSISYKHKRINASIYSLYSAAKKLEDYYLNGEDNIQYATPNGMPAWITLNIQGGVKLTKKENVMVNIGLENILDQNYRTFASGMSAAGRNLWLNLRVNF